MTSRARKRKLARETQKDVQTEYERPHNKDRYWEEPAAPSMVIAGQVYLAGAISRLRRDLRKK